MGHSYTGHTCGGHNCIHRNLKGEIARRFSSVDGVDDFNASDGPLQFEETAFACARNYFDEFHLSMQQDDENAEQRSEKVVSLHRPAIKAVDRDRIRAEAADKVLSVDPVKVGKLNTGAELNAELRAHQEHQAGYLGMTPHLSKTQINELKKEALVAKCVAARALRDAHRPPITPIVEASAPPALDSSQVSAPADLGLFITAKPPDLRGVGLRTFNSKELMAGMETAGMETAARTPDGIRDVLRVAFGRRLGCVWVVLGPCLGYN